MIIIGIIIIILLCRIIMNQQTIDYHICEVTNKRIIRYDEIIENRGIINRILGIINYKLLYISYRLKSKNK